ncbi:MAG: succinate dehydrogenase, hydrophobic membrane anchor protein [Parvibaculaceae bacterium]
MRTPLAKVRGLGSAKTGTEHFWHQRLTALANIPLVIFFIGFVLTHLGADAAQVAASLRNPFIAIVLALAFVSVTWHMRLGMQVIIEDYVHAPAAHLAALIANNFFTLLLGAVALYAIAVMSLGS